MNTRTVLLWHNNGETQFTFAVNPADITVSRPNVNRVADLALGGQINLWGGRGLREVRLDTFLPREGSPFFSGRSPDAILSLLKTWQDSGDPIRLIISGTDINDAFLIEDRHIVVIPAADAAGAFQLALVHEEDAQPLLARAESRAAAGRTGADDEHVRFDERTERMS